MSGLGPLVLWFLFTMAFGCIADKFIPISRES